MCGIFSLLPSAVCSGMATTLPGISPSPWPSPNEQKLHAQTYPQQGRATGHRLRDGEIDALFAQALHSVAEGTDARQEKLRGATYFVWVCADAHLGSAMLERAGDTEQVADPVVDQGDFTTHNFAPPHRPT